MRFLTSVPILLSLCTFASAGPIEPADVEAAIEAKYGPFASGASLHISVDSIAAYEGSKTANEKGLPYGFKAIVWDQKSDRFAALVEDSESGQIRIAGTASKQVFIPVATRRLSVGEVISADDVQLRPAKFNPNLSEYVSEISEIIGKEVTRPISQDRPVNAEFIAAKSVIKRNEEVVLIFNKGNLRLTAKGKSLSNAAIGDPVKIVRSEASRPLEGIAVAEGVVKITN